MKGERRGEEKGRGGGRGKLGGGEIKGEETKGSG